MAAKSRKTVTKRRKVQGRGRQKRKKSTLLSSIDWRRYGLWLVALLVVGGTMMLGYHWVTTRSDQALREAARARATPLSTLRIPAQPVSPPAPQRAAELAVPTPRPNETAAPAPPEATKPARNAAQPADEIKTAAVGNQPTATPPSAQPAQPQRPMVAIIIDDVGLNADAARRAARLPAPVTLAFLPYGKETPRLAATAKGAGHEIFVHLQMQPEGKADPGPHALVMGLGDAELRKRTDWALSRVPGAVGANNHMGSRMTADAHAMKIVLTELDHHDMAFIDSRTSAHSVAEATAESMGVPTSRRDVFLDNEQDARAIQAQLDETVRIARRHGTAIAIGHPHPATLAALEAWIPAMRKEGILFVRATDLIEVRRCRTAAAGDAAMACVQAQRIAAAPG